MQLLSSPLPEKHAAGGRAAKCAARCAALALLAFLGACERPLPPATPNRPQTMELRRAPVMHKAIFRYDLLCSRSRHPRQPRGDGDCTLLQV